MARLARLLSSPANAPRAFALVDPGTRYHVTQRGNRAPTIVPHSILCGIRATFSGKVIPAAGTGLR